MCIIILIEIMCLFLVLYLVRTIKNTQEHLRQIERKIDQIYTQIRKNDYVHPSEYPFVTKKF